MPFFGRPGFIEPALDEVMEMGLIPVLAHPERIEAFQDDPDMLKGFIERGMLSQITAGSVIGYWGEEVKRLTLALLGGKMAHVMASDTHHPDGKRSPMAGNRHRGGGAHRGHGRGEGDGDRHAEGNPERRAGRGRSAAWDIGDEHDHRRQTI